MMLRVLKALYSIRRHSRSRQVDLLYDLDLLKKTIATEYFFVRKNYLQIGEEIQTLIKMHRWNRLRRVLNLISIVELDSWLTLRKVALTLQQTINSTPQIEALNQDELEDLLAVLSLLRYEPVAKDGRLSQKYLYDDITNFTAFLKDYVQQTGKKGINEHYFQLVRYTVHSNPQLFENKKDQLQKYITNNLESMLGRGYYLTEVISRGLISNFWSHSFKQHLISKLQNGKYAKQLAPLLFQNLQIPTIIQPSSGSKRNKTEIDISNILEGYHYDVQSNMLINNYEVDALLGKMIVIEYNGHYHYALNSKEMVPTLKQAWKTSILHKRGFLVISIPYWQWKFLKLFEEKRDYLLKKVENSIIRHFS